MVSGELELLDLIVGWGGRPPIFGLRIVKFDGLGRVECWKALWLLAREKTGFNERARAGADFLASSSLFLNS